MRTKAGTPGSGAITVGAAVLAFLASQHHNLHMLIMALGLGGAGATFMQAYPAVRRVMLLISLTMVAVNAVSLRRGAMSARMRLWVVFFSILTLVLVVWSVIQFGL